MKKVILLLAVFICSANLIHAQWQQANGPYGGVIYAIATSGANIFAGTANGGVFLSNNNGSSWAPINNGLTNKNVSALAINSANIFAGTENGVFLSTNNGSSWTSVNTGLTNTGVSSFAISGTNIFAGTAGGVFLSTNNGSSWTSVSNGLSNKGASSLAISGTNIFAGTSGGGVWKRPLGEITSMNEANNEHFKCTVYPNPASHVLNMTVSPELIGKEYTVINTLGLPILSGNIKDNATAVSLKDMPRGVYFLHIVGTTVATKFIKE